MRTSICCLLLVIGFVACRGEGPTRERPEPKSLDAVSAESLRVAPGEEGVAWQYFEPGTGKAVAVTDPGKIPEKLRTNVIVLFRDERRDRVPAKALVLADLTRVEDGAHPIRIINRYEHRPRPAAAPPTAGAPASDADVLLYTAPGCGHCVRARAWLKQQGIPFVEKDLSSDPGAAAEIRAAGKAQGLSDAHLSGVPLLNVKGRVLVGFDPSQVQAALDR